METKYQYLELIYKEALNQVRCHIDSRYKILQFVGVYNAAIMTFGLRDMDIFKGSIKGVLVSGLSVFVAIVGLFTECCLIAYNRDYFYITRRIEEEFNQEIKKGTGNEALSEKGFLLTVTSK